MRDVSDSPQKKMPGYGWKQFWNALVHSNLQIHSHKIFKKIKHYNLET